MKALRSSFVALTLVLTSTVSLVAQSAATPAPAPRVRVKVNIPIETHYGSLDIIAPGSCYRPKR